jgi:hypothetical protein
MQIDSTSIIALIDRFGKLEVGNSFSVTKLPQGEARFNIEVERTTAGIKEEEETATIDLTGTKEEKRTTVGIKKEKSATVDLTAIEEEEATAARSTKEVTIKKEKVDAIKKKEIKKKTPKTAARKMAAPRSTRRTRSQNQTKDSADEVIGTYSIPVGGATVEIMDSDDESYVDHGFSQQVEVVCSLDSP